MKIYNIARNNERNMIMLVIDNAWFDGIIKKKMFIIFPRFAASHIISYLDIWSRISVDCQ